jgi:hypothetical protein
MQNYPTKFIPKRINNYIRYFAKCIDCSKLIAKEAKRCRKCQGKTRRIPLEIRFWKRVEKTPTCWVWKGLRTIWGYGEIWNGKRNVAHRVSWILHFGEIPKGMLICHHCDNRLCVRPDHLFLGTQADNNRDRDLKNRTMRGEQYPLHKLTPDMVKQIRSLYEWGKTKELAEHFKVSETLIFNVVHRKAWSHVI